MKVFTKYVTVEAVKDKQVLTLPFLDCNGMKPLTSATGSKGLDGDDFTDHYKERSVFNG